jgi:hypothetical protein
VSAAKLASVQRFLKAGLAMADIQARRAQESFEKTQHSCYEEGWAAGYRAAMETVDGFVGATVMEDSDA